MKAGLERPDARTGNDLVMIVKEVGVFEMRLRWGADVLKRESGGLV